MMTADEITRADRRGPPPAGEVVEVLLGLSPDQWSALEVVSRRRNLTIAQLGRRAIADFLRREREAESWAVVGKGT
jgi:hypothetical protein